MKDEEYAGFWIRVGANLIDLIILFTSFSLRLGWHGIVTIHFPTLSVIFNFTFDL